MYTVYFFVLVVDTDTTAMRWRFTLLRLLVGVLSEKSGEKPLRDETLDRGCKRNEQRLLFWGTI